VAATGTPSRLPNVRGTLAGLLARRALHLLPLLFGLLVVGWVGYKGSQNGSTFLSVTLNGITLAALFFVVAAGFTLIFGLMRVVNMAHGSLFLLAGYLAYKGQTSWFYHVSTTQLTLTPSYVSLGSWVVPLLFGTAVVGLVGLVMQQAFLRWNQGQDLRQALITIALSVIFADQMFAHFGGIAESISQPQGWPQSVKLGSIHYGFFRLAVVLGAAVAIGLGLWALIRRTRFGMIIRAGVDDRAMVSALGINIQVVFAAAFFLGALLAGLAGVLGGTMIAVAPGNDTQFLLYSLIVVIIGGMGSLGGAAIGALALGFVQSYSATYLKFGSTDLTNYSILLTFALVVVVLAVRPLGLFGRPA
jgi:branched-chain amino acid transport system permease protein